MSVKMRLKAGLLRPPDWAGPIGLGQAPESQDLN